jgi:phage-related protein
MPDPVFPTISSGDAWLAPATQTVTMQTEVVTFLDDSEQRWRSGDPLAAWDLTFSDITWADTQLLLNFFSTVKGAYQTPWTFPFIGTNYTGMAFELDAFEAVENQAQLWTVSMRFRQTVKSIAIPGGIVAVYPALSTGVVTQRPFTSRSKFLTTRNDMPTGARYSWAERAAALMSWTCEYSAITPAELGTYLNFFLAMGGRYKQFSFTDPNDNSVHAHCRHDMDGFAAKYLGAGQCAVTMQIAEFKG